MRPRPPKALVDLLERLGLATARQVQGMAGRVRRLAAGLPLFESVWVDALAQARVLTPFQAAEINAGRGLGLKVGPYVICDPDGPPSYAAFFRARHCDSRESVRMALATPAGDPSLVLAELKRLAAVSAPLAAEPLLPVRDAGLDAGRVWAVSRGAEGRAAADWTVHNGRFPPEVVLEIVRQMLVGLVPLEMARLCHGDLAAAGVFLSGDGSVALPMPGLRGVLRPREGFSLADLLPDAYDYLAPERIAEGSPPTVASDLYACGCLWWHLLTGRPPVPGATSLAKLQAIQRHRIAEVKTLAPETSNELAAVIAACLSRDPARRPASFAEVAARLGPPTYAGRTALARCVTRPGGRASPWTASVRTMRHSPHAPLWIAGGTAALVAATALAWSLWNAGFSPPTASIRSALQPTPHPAEKGVDQGVSGRGPAPSHDSSPPRPAPPPPGPLSTGTGEATARPDSISPRLPDERPPEDLVLPVDRPLAMASLAVQPGQRVTGPAGRRPTVLVPPMGLAIEAENARWENVDFVWEHSTAGPRASQPGAIVELRAAKAEFRNCTFRTAGLPHAPPAAIRWTHPADRRDVEMALPSGRVELTNCVLAGVGAGVECRTLGARSVRIVNALCLGPGPLVRFDHAPAADEPLSISLARTTVRGARAVLEVRDPRNEPRPGRISIDAAECALVPDEQGGLLVFEGPRAPESLLAGVQWTGQGSLVGPDAPVAVWADPAGRGVVMDDAALSIAGLVRSRVEFADRADSGAAGHRVTRWQVPLRSANPPGADVDTLPQPRNDPQDRPRLTTRPREIGL